MWQFSATFCLHIRVSSYMDKFLYLSAEPQLLWKGNAKRVPWIEVSDADAATNDKWHTISAWKSHVSQVQSAFFFSMDEEELEVSAVFEKLKMCESKTSLPLFSVVSYQI